MYKTIAYIAHPIAGDVEANLAAIRAIVKRINTEPQYADVVPFVPYYADVVSLDDNDPVQREKGLQNDIAILSRKGLVNELWLFGPVISAGMKREVLAAFRNGIPVHTKNAQLYPQLLTISEEYEANKN